jgi:MFS family permease
LYLLALFGGDLCMKVFIIPALRRFGFRRIIIVTGVFTAASIAACAFFSSATPPAVIIVVLFLHGALRSMVFTCLSTLAYTEIPPARISRANSFLSTIQQLVAGMGIAVGAITLRLVAHAGGHSAMAPQLRDFRFAILFLALLALGSVFNALGLPADAGARTSGHVPRELEMAE